MPRRETILRDDLDGGKRQHEVELRTWKATANDGRSVTLEAESWFAARQAARMELGVETVSLEEVEGEILAEHPPQRSVSHEITNALPEVMKMLTHGTSKQSLLSGELAEQMGLTPESEPETKSEPVPARLDPDGTAKPKTVLTAPVQTSREGTSSAGPAAFHIDRETGTRTSLTTTALERMKRRASGK